jgi:hypothetical protein
MPAVAVLALVLAAPPSLSDLAWMAGSWQAEGPGPVSEEVWLPPAGDNMIGMWRLVADGKARVYEFLTLTQEAEGPVLRLRHFDRALVGWEEKDKPLVLPLVRQGAREASFEGLASDGTRLRLHYRRPAEDRLAVTLLRGDQAQEFAFRLRP